ncbi:GNAT family N-acetyltransferase [Luteimicrobium sp. DT211]|uniref:GNAT family N-acetyltransferase n=1 Tax=Luteimicrobium sp. DT211 TaxID=3393412 RepID=UPI003CF97B3F
MSALPWPPEPLRTERLLLREPEAGDRAALVELMSSAEVGRFIGGSRPREEVERDLPDPPRRRPGLWVVEHDGATIGAVMLDPRDAADQGNLRPDVVTELGYLFLPDGWGRGYATEACAGVLRWFDGTGPGSPVALCTRTANLGSMRVAAKLGFTEAGRFHAFDAEQWLGVRAPGGEVA